MKIFYKALITLLMFPFSITASDVYYCVEEAKVGFEPKYNYESSNYKAQKYTVQIDFNNRQIISEAFLFSGSNTMGCHLSNVTSSMYCANNLGYLFAINKYSLKFHLSRAYLKSNQGDSINIAHGQCEKF
tara:strand:+ start:949 stop:1338 length:390 start_codon:yes stop_codon:yes gene_type:complete